jgi:hypothetical protein
MPLVLADLLADKIELEASIDGREFLDITSIRYSSEVNKARIINFTIAGRDALERCRLGGIVKIELGRGNQIHSLTFEGIIKSIQPGLETSTIMAIDYITQLATSEIVEYKSHQINNQDLYYLARNAADYKAVSVTGLTEGSGIKATEDMGLVGFWTRKGFIDRCFSFMHKDNSGSDYPPLSYTPWRYGIRNGSQMDFWYSDYKNYKAAPVLTLTEGDEVILDKGIVATIDTTKMVNSATYISKDDSTIYSTHTDEHSVDRYGPHGTRVFFDSDNRGRLLQLALTEVELNKEPTITYTIEMSNGEWLALGDLVRVVVPQLKRDDILPVARLDVNVGGRVTTSVTLGEARLSMGEVIKRLS